MYDSYLGILLDQELTFALHRLSRRHCYHQLRQLRTVARSLTTSAATTLVRDFITARLDYCLVCRLSCVDRVLRSSACLVGKIPKYDHVTRNMLDVLHWLPVRV